MKKIYLFMLLSCCFLMASIAMNAKSSDTAKEIDLSGDLETGKQRSLIKPIQVFIIEQSIEVDFNVGLGTIDVSIYDETGNAVYQQSVTTYAGQRIFIDITSFNPGEYTIGFIDSQGKYLEGNFEI